MFVLKKNSSIKMCKSFPVRISRILESEINKTLKGKNKKLNIKQIDLKLSFLLQEDWK